MKYFLVLLVALCINVQAGCNVVKRVQASVERLSDLVSVSQKSWDDATRSMQYIGYPKGHLSLCLTSCRSDEVLYCDKVLQWLGDRNGYIPVLVSQKTPLNH